LRERKDDIPVLVEQFLEEANRDFEKNVKGITELAMKYLKRYHWPGNVRELKNVIKKGVLLSESAYVKPENLLFVNTESVKENNYEKELEKGKSLKEILDSSTENVEKTILKHALMKSGGNKAKAAKILKITRTTLYSKMQKFQINKPL
ncbi:MAG: DNA-binding response regulator, partial [Candidatus Aminicenantes bacterium]|nr:DNA-binding response regulator [Candidatus Aminicenantes bacterium]